MTEIYAIIHESVTPEFVDTCTVHCFTNRAEAKDFLLEAWYKHTDRHPERFATLDQFADNITSICAWEQDNSEHNRERMFIQTVKLD